MTRLEKLLHKVLAGSIDFAEFVRDAHNDVIRMAEYLLKRWRAPLWFSQDDMMQEIYMGIYHYVWRWDSGGANLHRYVTYNAMNQAKRALHVARGVTISGAPDRKLSQLETLFADYELAERKLADLSIEAEAEKALGEEQERRQAVQAALKACETPKERYAVLAIREAGSLDKASTVLYDDIDHRIALRLHSEEHAERFVFSQAWQVAQRINSCVKSI